MQSLPKDPLDEETVVCVACEHPRATREERLYAPPACIWGTCDCATHERCYYHDSDACARWTFGGWEVIVTKLREERKSGERNA